MQLGSRPIGLYLVKLVREKSILVPPWECYIWICRRAIAVAIWAKLDRMLLAICYLLLATPAVMLSFQYSLRPLTHP